MNAFVSGWLLMLSLFCISCNKKTEGVKKPFDTLSSADLADPQIKALTEKVNADPDNPENYFLRSNAFLNINNLKAAYNDLSMAIALDSTELKYYFAMADLSLNGGSADAAITAFSQIIRRDPENEEAILKLSKVYFFQKEYSNSLIQLAKAEEINKQNPEIYFIRGLNLKEMQDTSGAVAAFQKTVTLDPKFYDAYIQLGLLHSNRPSHLAAQYFDNAIRLDSSSSEAYYNKAKFYQDRGDKAFEKSDVREADANYKEAKEIYQELITIDPQNESAYFNSGFIYIRQDSLDKAYRMFDYAIKVDPKYAEAYYYRGLISLEKGNKEQAQTDFRQTLALQPDNEKAQKELQALK